MLVPRLSQITPLLALLGCLLGTSALCAGEADVISQAAMDSVNAELSTPYKYGVLLTPGDGEYYDCPNVFRYDDKWWMVFVKTRDLVGYETCLAESDDLLHWTIAGTILPFRDSGWDKWQADGSIALVDPDWGGGAAISPFQGKYWMSYFGGDKQGYETDPLAIGMAHADRPSQCTPWTRLDENPVMRPGDADARVFEQKTLYKSHVFHDPAATLGKPLVMFYNAKQEGDWIERIGIAVSDDMRHWTRYGDGPVIDNLKGISGDPQIIRMNGLWVMVYFGAGWDRGAFDTFACSRDLVNWTKWDGAHLLQPSEPWDKTFAHKPWLLKHDDVVYHFYCAVGGKQRTIALATSKDLRAAESGSPK
ncbi:Glycosyl hydrolases family 43 [Pirellulimonas nuda]|uniref:Glycosyl hydrolases family 43 n=2 Tax=Pirellulimonas nuda TaxID=2528009 RepID=A0A518DG03_9BACT|nr:Glycosyl hydrolases family 43 [Pirellulimonas nuda]